MFFGSQILIFYAVGLQIRQNISFAVSLQFCARADRYVATRLMCRLISPCRQICSNKSLAVSLQFCSNKTNVPADLHELLSAAKNLPEYNIRIFNPLASYC